LFCFDISCLEVYLKCFGIICKLIGKCDVMAVSKKLSGAEHRKREKQKSAESELLKKVPKLNTYFSAPQASAATSRTSATLEQSEEGQGITKEVSWQQDDDQNTGTHSML